jgi:sulfur-oxidizing protein SoxY
MPQDLETQRCRRWTPVVFVLAIAVLTSLAAPAARADESEKSWGELRGALFGSRPIEDGGALLTLTAPVRADDPALVPVEIADLRPGGNAGSRIKALTLIVDENPAPVAAVFSLSPDAAVSALETRIRVNAYSFLRVVAETEDGVLHMVKRYVKATGGCSAPASKNADEAIRSLGQMRLRHYETKDAAGEAREVQLQIRHPNYSGLQMDQVTGLYRAAHYVNTIRITADGKPVMNVKGAISLSENPSLRFRYRAEGAKTLAAHVEDTEGNVFEQSWDASGEPSR